MSAQDPPLRKSQKVLQQRWYFSEPLVVRRRSVGKPHFPAVRTPRQGGANAWAKPKKKKPGTEKVLVVTRLMLC